MKPAHLALAALLLALSACSSNGSPNTGPSTPNQGTLQWGVAGVNDVPTLDPALVSDPTSISIASLVYGGLVRLDSHLRVIPDGAASWTISHRGSVYTFHLRPRLRFAGGRPVTSADFAFALKRAFSPAEAAGAASFYLNDIRHRGSRVTGVATEGRDTLRITLRHPSARFLSELAFPASYVPDPSVIRQYGSNWTNHAAGFGPYRVATWSHSRFLTLVRNTHYWGGRPSFRAIRLRFFTAGSGTAAYRNGAITILTGMAPGTAVISRVAGLRRVPALALDYLAFDTRDSPFNRLAARRAFAASWSPALVTQTLGLAVFPATEFLPSAFGIQVKPWTPRRNPAAYLARAGYRLGSGFPPLALVIPNNDGLLPLAQALVSRWQSHLGVRVVVRAVDPSVYDRVLADRSFQLAIVRWGADYPDPHDFLATQLGPSGSNLTGWSTATYMAAIRCADGANPNSVARSERIQQAGRVAADQVPLLPLDEPSVSALVNPNLLGVTLTALNTVSADWTRVRFR